MGNVSEGRVPQKRRDSAADSDQELHASGILAPEARVGSRRTPEYQEVARFSREGRKFLLLSLVSGSRYRFTERRGRCEGRAGRAGFLGTGALTRTRLEFIGTFCLLFAG